MSKYVFDSHKLAYHPDRVAEFKNTGDCYPLYIEISPVGACNYRCIFCVFDYLGYPNRRLDTQRTLCLIQEMAEAGLKSLLFAGEGEPLLHPDTDQFLAHCRYCNIDTGMFTNGSLLTDELADRILDNLTFIRFSFNGGTADNYAHIHNVSINMFEKVLANIKNAVRLKRRRELRLDLGIQYVLVPENIDYAFDAARRLKEIGVDYFSLKPFVLQSDAQAYDMPQRFSQDQLDSVFGLLESLEDDKFSVQVRREAFRKYGRRDYPHCLGTSFISVINSAGDIGTCGPFWDNPEYVYGNIYESSYEEIWKGQKRASIKHFLENELDVKKVCPPHCRCHPINSFLTEICEPTARHINFV